MYIIQFLFVFSIAGTLLQTGTSIRNLPEVLKNNPCPEFKEGTCTENHVTFHLRTKDHQEGTEDILDALKSHTIENAHFVQNQPIKFIIHGHHQDPSLSTENKDPTMIPLQKEYFKLNYNVIFIRYTELSKDPCYRTGILNSKKIARCATEIIEKIVQYGQISLDRFHIIGLSLGGQIAGQMSQFLDEGKFTRITGIEPANEGFFDRYELPDYILDKTDAEYVDVIHTSCVVGRFSPMGHADFYVNSGIIQPKCKNHLCSHLRSLMLFLESITDTKLINMNEYESLENAFLKKHDKKTADFTFGEQAGNTKPEGIFFFETRQDPPYIRDPNDENYKFSDYYLYKFQFEYTPSSLNYYDGPPSQNN